MSSIFSKQLPFFFPNQIIYFSLYHFQSLSFEVTLFLSLFYSKQFFPYFLFFLILYVLLTLFLFLCSFLCLFFQSLFLFFQYFLKRYPLPTTSLYLPVFHCEFRYPDFSLTHHAKFERPYPFLFAWRSQAQICETNFTFSSLFRPFSLSSLFSFPHLVFLILSLSFSLSLYLLTSLTFSLYFSLSLRFFYNLSFLIHFSFLSRSLSVSFCLFLSSTIAT